jgi:Icc-related predicted phosphoesterase
LTKLFFATDVHGSDICWNKFINSGKFYGADISILGGDISGKAIVPIVNLGYGKHKVVLLQQESILEDESQLANMEKMIRSRGYYPYRTTHDELDALNNDHDALENLFTKQVLLRMEQWIAIADKKLADSSTPIYISLGNDDIFELDDLIRSTAKSIRLVDGEVVEIDRDSEMISSGWSNPTPWKTAREENEEHLEIRFNKMIRQLKRPEMSIFNFHVPPFNSGLDEAPELTDDMRPKHAGNALIPVGSKTVRSLIEKYKPALGLFGHIHESKGTSRIGKTLCVNPGSMYEQGCLLGALVTIEKGKTKNHILTTG